TPCSAQVTGPGSLDAPVSVEYTDNTAAGEATASATFAATDNYNTSTDSKNFTIGKADTVTVVTCDAGPFTYTGSAQTPCSAQVTGPGSLDAPVSVEYTDNTAAGEATASATFAATDNYNTSTDSKNFTIGKADTVTVVTCDASPSTRRSSDLTPCSAQVTGPG